MKIIITTILTIATLASADFYDTQTARWHSNRSTLPTARAQTVGLHNASHKLLASHNILLGVVNDVPDGMIHTGGWTITITNDVAYRVPVVLTQQAYETQVQEATHTKLQDVINSPAAQPIRELEHIIDFFGIARPVQKADAIAHIETWQMYQIATTNTVNMVIGNTRSIKLVALFDSLESAGIDEAKINAVWTYMVATGQDE